MPTRPLAPVVHYLRRIEAEAHERHDSDRDLLGRFARSGDETAFAALLKRHGPLVYGVCRRVLRDRHAAEDAFQATFLLLVRKAASLRRPELLGNWLHGVAYRTALKARARAARHAADTLGGDIPARADDDALWRDLRLVLDRAIDELPAKYRIPFVLCHLQGMTNRQAARQIGCPEGTVATRLSRARQRLRGRLARHGLAVAAGAAALSIGAGALLAGPPSLLIVTTLRIATAFRLGTSAAVPATVAALTEGVGKAMMMTKVRLMFAAIALCATTLAGGTALWALGGQEPQPPRPDQPPPRVVTAEPVAPVPPAPSIAPQVPQNPGAGAADDKLPAVVRTDNFIVHAPTRRIAQLVGDAAERLRKSEAIRWLGKPLPAWSEPCTVNVALAKAGSFNGATAFRFSGAGAGAARVLERNMTLEGTLDHVLSSGLPHEITHTVLADHFRTPIPRWADEGAALQAEDLEEQERHQTLMRKHTEPSRFIPLTKLFAMREYPPDVMALYVEGYSLTRFLLQRKDRKTFLAYVKQGMNGNAWDAAVKKHYGFDDVASLEKAWLASADMKAHAEITAQAPAVIKSGPPTIGRASIDTNGRLVLRTPTTYYLPVTGYRHNGDKSTAIPVTSYELKVAEHVARHDLKTVKATDLAGKPIDAKTLGKRLQKEAAVLIAAGWEGVDPYYLGVMRADTIILTPPAVPTTPAADPTAYPVGDVVVPVPPRAITPPAAAPVVSPPHPKARP